MSAEGGKCSFYVGVNRISLISSKNVTAWSLYPVIEFYVAVFYVNVNLTPRNVLKVNVMCLRAMIPPLKRDPAAVEVTLLLSAMFAECHFLCSWHQIACEFLALC